MKVAHNLINMDQQSLKSIYKLGSQGSGKSGATGSIPCVGFDNSNLTDWLVIQTQLVVYSKSDQTGRNYQAAR
jgi:hypothetical protein